MEDIKLKRKTRVVETTFSVTAISQVFLPANNNRIAILLGAHSGINYWVSMRDGVVAGTGPVSVFAGLGGWRLTLEDDGDFVTQKLFIIGNAAGTIAVAEVELIGE